MKKIKLTFEADLSNEKDKKEILTFLELIAELQVQEWLDNKITNIKAEFVD